METLLETEKLVARPSFKDHYDNFIGGEWKSPVKGEYFDSISPIDGQAFTKVPRSGKEDIELALDYLNIDKTGEEHHKEERQQENQANAFTEPLLLFVMVVR